MNVMTMAAQERSDFLELLSTLSKHQWHERSLCDDWTVRDVAAHVTSLDVTDAWAAARRLVAARGDIDVLNEITTTRDDTLTPPEVVERLRRHLEPTGIMRMLGGRIALLDALVHQQDIRRPLGLPRQIPPERLLAALKFAPHAYVAGFAGRLSGLRFRASDLTWDTGGRGPSVEGPAEALLMAIAGRACALDDLTGPGVVCFSERLTTS